MINQPDEIYVFKTDFKLIFKVVLRSVEIRCKKMGVHCRSQVLMLKLGSHIFYHFQLQGEPPYSQINPPWNQEGASRAPG
jgi:hypothetical protein